MFDGTQEFLVVTQQKDKIFSAKQLNMACSTVRESFTVILPTFYGDFMTFHREKTLTKVISC